MVTPAFPLGFHTAEPHANPRVQAVERPASSEKPRSKVLSRTPNNPVKFLHLCGVEVVFAASQFPDLIFKFLHGLEPHAPGTAGEDKPQKGVALSIGGHFRFLRAQVKREPLFEHLLHKSQRLFGLVWSLTNHHEIIGITDKPITRVVELSIQMVEDDVGQKWRNHPALWGAN